MPTTTIYLNRKVADWLRANKILKSKFINELVNATIETCKSDKKAKDAVLRFYSINAPKKTKRDWMDNKEMIELETKIVNLLYEAELNERLTMLYRIILADLEVEVETDPKLKDKIIAGMNDANKKWLML